MTELVTVAELARILKLPTRTTYDVLRDLVREKRPGPVRVRRAWRADPEAVIASLKQREEERLT